VLGPPPHRILWKTGIVPFECRCEIMAVDLESSVRCCCLYFIVKIRFETNREVGPRDVDRLLQA
jgi:hypothetical protein